MRRILSVLLENESGALSRVVGLFSQRAFNIESLTVAPTDDSTLSRMTIEAYGDEQVLEQIEKQLHKLVDVFKVINLSDCEHVEREVMLLKIKAVGAVRDEIKRLADFPWPNCRCDYKILHGAINRYKRQIGRFCFCGKRRNFRYRNCPLGINQFVAR